MTQSDRMHAAAVALLEVVTDEFIELPPVAGSLIVVQLGVCEHGGLSRIEVDYIPNADGKVIATMKLGRSDEGLIGLEKGEPVE